MLWYSVLLGILGIMLAMRYCSTIIYCCINGWYVYMTWQSITTDKVAPEPYLLYWMSLGVLRMVEMCIPLLLHLPFYLELQIVYALLALYEVEHGHVIMIAMDMLYKDEMIPPMSNYRKIVDGLISAWNRR